MAFPFAGVVKESGGTRERRRADPMLLADDAGTQSVGTGRGGEGPRSGQRLSGQGHIGGRTPVRRLDAIGLNEPPDWMRIRA